MYVAVFIVFSSDLRRGKATVACTKSQQRKEEESERLTGKRDYNICSICKLLSLVSNSEIRDVCLAATLINQSFRLYIDI